jgi:hypothetical protein
MVVKNITEPFYTIQHHFVVQHFMFCHPGACNVLAHWLRPSYKGELKDKCSTEDCEAPALETLIRVQVTSVKQECTGGVEFSVTQFIDQMSCCGVGLEFCPRLAAAIGQGLAVLRT